MATADAIEALYQLHTKSIKDPMHVAQNSCWGDIRTLQLTTLPHHVVCRAFASGHDFEESRKEVFDWLYDNVGIECLDGCNFGQLDVAITWQRGAWDWYWSDVHSNVLEFLFLDPADATAFKLRWC